MKKSNFICQNMFLVYLPNVSDVGYLLGQILSAGDDLGLFSLEPSETQ